MLFYCLFRIVISIWNNKMMDNDYDILWWLSLLAVVCSKDHLLSLLCVLCVWSQCKYSRLQPTPCWVYLYFIPLCVNIPSLLSCSERVGRGAEQLPGWWCCHGRSSCGALLAFCSVPLGMGFFFPCEKKVVHTVLWHLREHPEPCFRLHGKAQKDQLLVRENYLNWNSLLILSCSIIVWW